MIDTMTPYKSMIVAFASVVCLICPSRAQPQGEQKTVSGVPVEFINAYVTAIPGFDSGHESAIKWVSKRKDVNERFKAALAKLYRDALKADPEIGYGADAVLSAQDFPKSFCLKSAKVGPPKGGSMAVLAGEAPMDTELKIKLVLQDETWLVDESGDLMK
jgi:hypothetical protein